MSSAVSVFCSSEATLGNNLPEISNAVLICLLAAASCSRHSNYGWSRHITLVIHRQAASTV